MPKKNDRKTCSTCKHEHHKPLGFGWPEALSSVPYDVCACSDVSSCVFHQFHFDEKPVRPSNKRLKEKALEKVERQKNEWEAKADIDLPVYTVHDVEFIIDHVKAYFHDMAESGAGYRNHWGDRTNQVLNVVKNLLKGDCSCHVKHYDWCALAKLDKAKSIK